MGTELDRLQVTSLKHLKSHKRQRFKKQTNKQKKPRKDVKNHIKGEAANLKIGELHNVQLD